MIEIHVDRCWDGKPAHSRERVHVMLADEEDGLRIEVDAPFHDDPPPRGAPGPTNGLWEHEVVELFVVGRGEDSTDVPYTEIELSPHGHYLVLILRGIRRTVARELPISYEAVIEGKRWRGVARIPRGLLPKEPSRLNAFAVHGVGERRRHLVWAVLPGPRPDFHQPLCFPSLRAFD